MSWYNVFSHNFKMFVIEICIFWHVNDNELSLDL